MGSHLAIHAASNHRWRVPPSWGGAATGSGPGEGMRPEGRAAATRTGAAAARGGKGTRPEGECNLVKLVDARDLCRRQASVVRLPERMKLTDNPLVSGRRTKPIDNPCVVRLTN